MPPGSNASRKPAGRSVNQLHGDGVAAGAKSMKRGKRGADSSVESTVSKKRFVGVRQRPSGRWVAEIKDTTQKIRLWLGTFDSAEEGAKAYDSAARALRGANTRTNFVAAIASSCEATVPTKAARLIRLRQTAAAASSKACANFTELGRGPNQLIPRPAFHQGSGNWDAHSQEGTLAPSAITSETLSNAINHSLAEFPQEHPRLTCNSASTTAAASSATDVEFPADGGNKLHPSPSPSPSPLPPPQQESFPCATNRADEEAASSADDNEVMFTGMNAHALHTDGRTTCQDDAESCALSKDRMEPSRSSDDLYHVDDPLDHRDNPILDMIPWPDYVLMDGLDLSCETSSTGVYPAFDFSTEAMDRDSEHYLSDDSSDFLLRLQQQPPQHSSSFQGQCEIPKSSSSTTDQFSRPPVSPPADGLSPDSINSHEAGECPSQADQALWSSMDLGPLCMVA